MNEIEQYGQMPLDSPDGNGHVVAAEQPSADMLGMVWGVLRRWYIVIAVFVLVCGSALPAIWHFMEPEYTVSAAIRVAPIIQNILTGEAERGEVSNYTMFVNTQARIVTSSRVVERVADELAGRNLAFFAEYQGTIQDQLKQTIRGTTASTNPVDILNRAINDRVIRAEPARNTELIIVSMTSSNQQDARRIVDSFVRHYMAVEGSASAQGQDEELRLLENERDALSERLRSQNEQIYAMAQEYGTTALTGRQEMMLGHVSTILAQLTELEWKRAQLEAEVEMLENNPRADVSFQDQVQRREDFIKSEPRVRRLSENIAALEEDLIATGQRLAEDHPTLQQKEEFIDALRERLEQTEQELGEKFDERMARQSELASQAELETVRAQLDQTIQYEQRLRQRLQDEDSRTIELGRSQLQIAELQDQMEITRQMYDQLGRRIQHLEMQGKRPGRISPAQPAQVASTEDKRIQLSIAAIFAGLAGGAGLAFLADKADKRIRDPEKLMRQMGVRIIGTTTSPKAVKMKELPQQVARDYESIFANLDMITLGGLPRTIVITSAGMGDGKTTSSINIAGTLARAGKKVLLIDGDMRKPEIANTLHMPSSDCGLQAVLLGDDFHRAVRPYPRGGYDLLSPSYHNNMDVYKLLRLTTTEDFMDKMTQEYDHVVIDTPPVLAFPDAMIWAKMAGAVILSSLLGKTDSQDLKRAKEKLNQARIEVLGTIIHNVDIEDSVYRYGYGYQYADRNRSRNKRDRKLLLPDNPIN